tara:strand:- start:1003 stop:1263 length:261 start_codon:yes stop_codon:yes gene_type:complete
MEVIERLAELNCDPIEGMAIIAMDMANSAELRGRMFAELAQYVAPKRKALEHSGEIHHNYVARVPEVTKNLGEWQKQNEAPPQTIQ